MKTPKPEKAEYGSSDADAEDMRVRAIQKRRFADEGSRSEEKLVIHEDADLRTIQRQIEALVELGAKIPRLVYRVNGSLGLRLDVRKRGAMTWRLNYRPRRGKSRTMSLGAYWAPGGAIQQVSLKRAREEAKAARAAVDTYRDPLTERTAKAIEAAAERARAANADALSIPTLVKAALGVLAAECRDAGRAIPPQYDPANDEHYPPIKMKPTTAEVWRRAARIYIYPAFSGKHAADVTRDEIRAWGRVNCRRSGYQALMAWDVLLRVYNWAAGYGLLDRTPFYALEKPFVRAVSDRVLSTDEIHYLLRALRILERGRPVAKSDTRYERNRPPRPQAVMVRLLLLTGVRRENVRTMRASEMEGLDGPNPTWVIPAERMKSGRKHSIPLSRQAAEIIRARCDLVASAGFDHLFPIHQSVHTRKQPVSAAQRWSTWLVADLKLTMRRLMEKEAKRAGLPAPVIERFKIHNLRHTLITHMGDDLQVDDRIGALILSHAVPGVSQVTAGYNRAVRMPERKHALQLWADWLDGVAKQRPYRRTARVIDLRRRAG